MEKSNKNPSNRIIGRIQEQEILRQILSSKKAEFLAVYGRRRVGKTYLIRNFFDQSTCVFFRCTGLQKGSMKEQLEQFAKGIGTAFYLGASLQARSKWVDAFDDLNKAIQSVLGKKKIVLFFDELPWMVTKKSKLLESIDYFWNHHWSLNQRIKLIVCGSSASWIIDKIINNRGGLHNRITKKMPLEPFTLLESQNFLISLNIKLNQRQTLELYMILGGIPYYLSQIKRGVSAKQAIGELCFQKNGALIDEFDRLFASLFHDSEIYIDYIRTIAKHRSGIGQAQLLRDIKVKEGGRAVKRLRELEQAGFIQSFLPYGHQSKGIYFKIVDEYTLFYLNWIEPRIQSIKKEENGSSYWVAKARSPAWKAWSGLAFEAVCLKHLSQIRVALHISPEAETGSWRYTPRSHSDKDGAQIDLLFDRSDGAITICEIKYNEIPFVIDKAYAKMLMKKIEIYRQNTRTQKEIFLAMVTSGGLKPSLSSKELVSQQITLDALFKSL